MFVLFRQDNFRSNGELVYEATVPDSITSWAISAIAIHKDAGFGITPDSTKVCQLCGQLLIVFKSNGLIIFYCFS